MPDRVFQRGADAVVMAVRFVGRNEVGDVADDEQVAGGGVEQQDGVHAGVAARDDQRVGILSGAQVFVDVVFRAIPRFLEALETGGKAFEQVL